jgi:hypothetical protein
MKKLSFSALFLFGLLVVAPAQTPEAAPTPAPKTAKPAGTAKAKAEKVDPLEKERRDTALRLINDLADEARTFRNEMLRARVQTRAADTLWETDQERARALFARAWDAADSADRETRRKLDEENRVRIERGEPFTYRSPPNLRNEVLRAATRRDRTLGEELLAKLDEARKNETPINNNSANAKPENADPTRPSPALAQRLEAARDLLQMGETERALQFADPGLVTVTMPGLEFLSKLRQTNAAAADRRYSAMMARAANAPDTNAGTVSLLSSYIFTPGMFFYITPTGGQSTYSSGRRPAIDAPQLRAAFLNFAAAVLTRELPPLDGPNAKGLRTGVYLVALRLLPLFEQFAPDSVGALRAQVAAVAADVSEEARDPRNPWLKRGLTPEEDDAGDSETALERAERAKDPEERDSLYASAALNLLRKEPARCYDIADKIADTDLRKRVRSYLDFALLGQALRKKDGPEALRLARKGDLTNIQRVWGLTEAAFVLSKSDRATATEVLQEAATETRRISGSDANRARGLIAVATRFYELDRARAWEFISEAVKAANSCETFTGEDSSIEAGVLAKNFGWMTSSSAESFDLAGLFRNLTKEDMNRAVQTAKGFNQEAPRATALLAIVRQTLSKKGGDPQISRETSMQNVEN